MSLVDVEKNMFDKSVELISSNFDKEIKCNETISLDDGIDTFTIRRNCFQEDACKPYFEDYGVSFRKILQDQEVYSNFYLEWKDGRINTELVLASKMKINIWCPRRKIKYNI